MATLKRRDLARLLANWDPAIRLLLLAGPDESGSREAAALAFKALADADDPLSVADIGADALRSDPALLADEAAAVSMFGGRRAIRVSGAGDAQTRAAELLLEAPVAGNPVVMLGGNLTKASRLRKLAEKSPLARLLISYPLEGLPLRHWLREAAAERGLQLTRAVAERLLALADGDTGILAAELDKFQLFLNADHDHPQRLDREAFLALAADSSEEDISALVAAVITASRPALERQLRLLADSSAIPALRATARRLMQMRQARAAMATGADAASAVRALRPSIYPFAAQDAVVAALPDWPTPRIEAALMQLLLAERQIKSHRGPGDRAGWQAIITLGDTQVPG